MLVGLLLGGRFEVNIWRERVYMRRVHPVVDCLCQLSVAALNVHRQCPLVLLIKVGCREFGAVGSKDVGCLRMEQRTKLST